MYKFIHLGNVVIAITTYAGKTVKAYAKCHSDDRFDVEFGEKLAQARCNVKVAKKRAARAKKKHIEAVRIVAEAQAHENKMFNYMNDSADAVVVATKELEALLASTK
jgi:hypothetical protein